MAHVSLLPASGEESAMPSVAQHDDISVRRGCQWPNAGTNVQEPRTSVFAGSHTSANKNQEWISPKEASACGWRGAPALLQLPCSLGRRDSSAILSLAQLRALVNSAPVPAVPAPKDSTMISDVLSYEQAGFRMPQSKESNHGGHMNMVGWKCPHEALLALPLVVMCFFFSRGMLVSAIFLRARGIATAIFQLKHIKCSLVSQRRSWVLFLLSCMRQTRQDSQAAAKQRSTWPLQWGSVARWALCRPTILACLAFFFRCFWCGLTSGTAKLVTCRFRSSHLPL